MTGKIIDVRDHGAVGDGRTKNTTAIQSAIDACEQGGTVFLSEGIYVSGALFLKSNMTLLIDENTKLVGSTELEDYPIMNYRFEGIETTCYASLINVSVKERDYVSTSVNMAKVDGAGECYLENIYIEGKGTIDANGRVLYKKELEAKENTKILDIKRGRAVCIRNCRGVQIKDVTIRQSPAWCLHLIYCQDVKIDGIRVYTKKDEQGIAYDIINADGIDIDSCKCVEIADAYIESEDDCIAIKSGKNEEGRKVGIPTEQVRIHNCEFKSGFGVAIGSEMSGDVRNVQVDNCRFYDTYSVASIKTRRGRGGVIKNITFIDCEHVNQSKEFSDCKWFRGAIYVDQFYSLDEVDVNNKEKRDVGTSIIRNLYFKNIKTSTIAGNAIFLAGLPEQPLENIVMENIQANGKYGMKAYLINGLKLKNVHVKAAEGKDMELSDVTNS